MEQVLLFLKDKNVVLKSANFDKEEELQELIKNNPLLIDLSTIFDSPIMIIGRESEHIDVLAITADAVPVIIECKRKDNPDMRYLIAQVFEYASKLNQKSFNEFDKMVTSYFSGDRCQEEQYKGLSMMSAFSKFKEDEKDVDETEDEIDYKQLISERLENGEFYLLVVVDIISEVASQTINFFNQKLNKLRIEIIEVSKFVDGERKIFVPTHVNREETKKAKTSKPGKITFEELINSCGEKEAGYIRIFHNKWIEDDDSSISMGSKGFSAWYKNTPALYVLTNRIQIAPRIKREYPDLFDPLLEKVKKYFSKTTQASGMFDSPDFNNDKMLSFTEEVIEILKESFETK